MHAIAFNSARASFLEWAQMTLLGANLIWTTLCLGGYRPETLVVTSMLTSALVMVHLVARAMEARVLREHPAGAWLLPFLGWAAINVFAVSPVPWLGWRDWLGWTNLIATFWVVLNGIRSPGPRRALFGVLVLLGIVAVAMGCYQRFVQPGWLMQGLHQVEQFVGRASGPFGIPNSLAAFLILLLPAVGALAFRRRATALARVGWGWVAAVFVLGLLLTLSRGAWIGLALALMAWPFGMKRWRWPRRVGIAAAVLGGLVCAGAVAYQMSPRVHERVDRLLRDGGERSRPILWQAAWNLFREHPLTGSGAGSYNVLFERHRPKGFNDEPQWAHNDYLNTLSDYGLIGFGLLFCGCAGVACTGWRSRREPGSGPRHRLEAAESNRALRIGVLAFAVHLAVDFNLKIPALAMAFAVCAALAWQRRDPAERPGENSILRSSLARCFSLAGAAAVAFAIIPVTRVYRAEALRAEARQALDSRLARSVEDRAAPLWLAEANLRRAVALDEKNGGVWADLAFALEMRAFAEPGRTREQGALAEAAARRALAISNVVPEFWIRLGVALDMRGRTDEARAAFLRCRDLAPNNSHAWYYYAYHLARDTNQHDAALRAVATCLSLDPGNTAAEALQAKLNVRPKGALFVP